jgi:hypothetical protein
MDLWHINKWNGKWNPLLLKIPQPLFFPRSETSSFITINSSVIPVFHLASSLEDEGGSGGVAPHILTGYHGTGSLVDPGAGLNMSSKGNVSSSAMN